MTTQTTDSVYLTVTYCGDHGGHADAFRTLPGALAEIQRWRAERIDEQTIDGQEPDPADLFDTDTPYEVVSAEMAIRVEVDADGVPCPIPLGD